ncbi:hypothetical protein [Streptomyces sp. NPDC057287]|uniref:hypothetical protein n=1 Tax=Streptomyces sp. NPDC057287 TaxID=3346086 RepID=UPI0036436413
MTDRIEHTTDSDPVSAKEARHNGTPENTPSTAPSTTPGSTSGRTPGEEPVRTPGATSGRTPGTASGITSGDGKSLKPGSGGPDDLSVPPAPRTAPAAQASERAGRHGTAGTESTPVSRAGTEGPLVSRDDQDKLSQRMQQAVTDFVESPRRAVEEADSTFDQIVSGLTEALTERRRVLRASWQEQDTDAQTEELRIALQRYRDISEQLLKI